MIGFKKFLAERDIPDNYHLEVHQDLVSLARKEKSYSIGAANYHDLAASAKHDDGKALIHHYDKHIEPELKKRGYPEKNTDKYHEFQKHMMSKWRTE